MTVRQSILKYLSENKIPINTENLCNNLIEQKYIVFNGVVPPNQKISYTLGRLYKNNEIQRKKKENGKGYLYYIFDDNLEKNILENKKETTENIIIDYIEDEKDDIIKDDITVDYFDDSISKLSLEDKFKEKTGEDFDDFYKKYKPKLVWYLTKYTRDQEISEDFADDAFTQSLLKIDNYNNEKSQIHTWVYKIAENLVKKDFKDKNKLCVVSLDKENDDNLNLMNIIPNGHYKEITVIEQDKILLKKAEIVKDAIFKLPEKYKKVMILRELENKPYLDVSELCVKSFKYDLLLEEISLPYVIDFIDLKIENNSDVKSYINITYDPDGNNECTIQFVIEPFDNFYISKEEIDNVSCLEINSKKSLKVNYNVATNLSTIKSQISKGRQLIQSMVHKKFKLLDEQGLH